MAPSLQTNPLSSERADRVSVKLADRSYDIIIQDGLLDRVGEQLQPLKVGPAAVVVTNPTVKRLYGARVQRSLRSAGFRVTVLTIPDGERFKTLKSVGTILDQLVRHRFERTTWLIALGGGVIGDMAGFAASAYLRGIPFVQVPTTLVAQVDSSIGGKTGVNHPQGKNLIGAFYQPKLVLCDPRALETLPEREYRAGLAEVIKYGVIQDAGFFRFLEQHMERVLAMDPEAVLRVIRTSCAIKAQVVAADEHEGGRRRILNFGHTLGHALETVTRYRRYKHGESVAIGMVAAARLARGLALADRDVETRIAAVVSKAGLPGTWPHVAPAAYLRAMRQDKKVKSGRIHFVLPTRIGKVVVVPVEEDAIREVLKG